MKKIVRGLLQNEDCYKIKSIFHQFKIVLQDETTESQRDDAIPVCRFHCVFRNCNVLKLDCTIDHACHGVPNTHIRNIKLNNRCCNDNYLKNAFSVIFQYVQNINPNQEWWWESKNNDYLFDSFSKTNFIKEHWERKESKDFVSFFEIGWEWHWEDCQI